jgi:hypothetical protein
MNFGLDKGDTALGNVETAVPPPVGCTDEG